MDTGHNPPRKNDNPGRENTAAEKNATAQTVAERAAALNAALSHIAVCQAPDVRLIGDGRNNILFRRTASRPIRKLPLTPLQTYVWLHAASPIAISRLIGLICERIDGIAPTDVAWVVTDLRRDGYLKTLAGANGGANDEALPS